MSEKPSGYIPDNENGKNTTLTLQERQINLDDQRLFVSSHLGTNFSILLESEPSVFGNLRESAQNSITTTLEGIRTFRENNKASFWEKIGKKNTNIFHLEGLDESEREIAAAALIRMYKMPRRLLGFISMNIVLNLLENKIQQIMKNL